MATHRSCRGTALSGHGPHDKGGPAIMPSRNRERRGMLDGKDPLATSLQLCTYYQQATFYTGKAGRRGK